MALQFSRVTLYNDNDDSCDSFLVSGIPKDCSDLEYYTHYDNFIKYLDESTDIQVEIDTFLYGEGEVVVASIEEIAYLHLRIQADDDFLNKHAHYVQSSAFTLHYSPDELFGIDWGVSMTEMYYDTLLGHIGLYDEGKQLHSMKEVADFIHTHDCGYIAEADGTPLLEFVNGEIDECTDMRFRDELMAELRKCEGFEDRYRW